MKKLLLIAFAFFAAVAQPARAEVTIDITGAHANPLPIAIPSFSASAEDKGLAQRITAVLVADLERSGLFVGMDEGAFLQSFDTIHTQPRFPDWQVINAQALVQGEAETLADGRVKVSFRLWDIFAQRQMAGQAFVTEGENWRRIAHIVADAVYKRITGESGYFDTRIVYIAEKGSKLNRIKRLAIMDQDGANHKYLTNGDALVLTPRFSPTVQQITYMSYYNDVPRVYLFDIETGHQEIIGEFPGMTFAPRFAPSGKSVIMSLALDGNSEIYSYDLKKKTQKRLTRHPSIDTSPCYSPDSKYITFNSDRSGTQQLYVMDADGDNVRRISFGEGRYATPVWSPRGDYIAFTKMLGGRFYIGVMHPDGSGERLLAEGYMVEGPTWAPNGRRLIYFRETKGGRFRRGSVRLYSIDLTGYNERLITTPLDASDPAWSPVLP